MFALLRMAMLDGSSGPGCMPTYANWNCSVDPLPGDYGPYLPFDHGSPMPPAGEQYWETDQCKMDWDNGTCR